MKYTVQITEVSHWVHEYEVDAKSSEEALHNAESQYCANIGASYNYQEKSYISNIRIKDSIDKEFFNRITNNLLGEQNA